MLGGYTPVETSILFYNSSAADAANPRSAAAIAGTAMRTP